MNKNLRVQKLVIAALLTAIAIIIPTQFGFLKIVIPPFSATLGSHIPMFLAMLISPYVAIIVGIGSALGFYVVAPPFIAARALMHSIVGFVGAVILRKTKSYKKAIIITAPLHGILEGLVVIPFGFTFYQVLIVTAVGTILHHAMDGAITYWLNETIKKTAKRDLFKEFNKDLFEKAKTDSLRMDKSA